MNTRDRIIVMLAVLLAFALMITGCSPVVQSSTESIKTSVTEENSIDDDGLMPHLVNTAWQLVIIRDFDALLQADLANPAILELKEDGTFVMSTGCGEMGGSYTLEGDDIAFIIQMTTAVVGCTDYQVAQALTIESLIPDASHFNLDGETMTLSVDNDHDAIFERLQKIDDDGLTPDSDS